MATLGDTSSAQSVTTAGRALWDDADASAQRTTLGLGTLATQSGTFSGTSSGTNTGDQTLPTRASLALDTTDSPQFAGLNVGAATDTTITRTGAGDIAVEGNGLYRAGGTDVPVADGGTGSSTASAARTALGLVIGTDVRAQGSGDPTLASLGGALAAHPHPLDAYAIDATYGDDFTAASLNAAWTARNYTGETFQNGPKATFLRVTKAGRTRGDGYFRTAPSGDWTFAMAFIPRWFAGGPVAWGVAVVDTNGTGVGTCFYGGPPNAFLLGQITTYTAYGGAYVQPGGAGAGPNIATIPIAYWPLDRKVWVYLRKSGTNYYAAYSLDGELWTPESSAQAWAGTVDRVAMMDGPLGNVTSGTGVGSYVDVDWFNKIA